MRLADAALAHAHAGSMHRTLELLEKIKVDSEDNATKEIVLSALSRLAEFEKDNDLQLAVLERKLELHPGDATARFDLAYKHSESKNADMALHHYAKIPVPSRDATTWNNLGVSFGEINLPVNSVRAYRKAEAANETLAMSNLGYKLLSAGFIEEAQKECDKALAIPNYHKNIPQLLARLKEVPEEEQKSLDESLENIKPKAAFYRQLGEAATLKIPKMVAARWQCAECVLDLTLSGTTIKLSGTYKRASSPLVSALMGTSAIQKVTTHKIEYNGKLRGQMIIGDVSRSNDGEQTTFIALELGKIKVLMHFSADGSELHVMENPHSTAPKFDVLKKVPGTSEISVII